MTSLVAAVAPRTGKIIIKISMLKMRKFATKWYHTLYLADRLKLRLKVRIYAIYAIYANEKHSVFSQSSEIAFES